MTESNLTAQERKGLRSLENRKNESEIVITMTDKVMYNEKRRIHKAGRGACRERQGDNQGRDMILRYDARRKEWEWNKEEEEEEEQKAKEGESKDERMARVLQPAMNGINSDLVFTTELPEDFDDDRLPTLDFKMWLEDDMEINHTFYETTMKTQMMMPRRSAMAEKMKISIASNDLNRRLSNINIERMPESERLEVVDMFTHQLKNSGYS